MLSLKNVLPNFLRSAVFVAATVFSFSVIADGHGDHSDAPVVEEAVEAEASEAAVEAEVVEAEAVEAEDGEAAVEEATEMLKDAAEDETASMMPSK